MFVILYTTENTGNVGIDLGGENIINEQTTQRRYNATFDPGDDETVTVEINEDITYTFRIKPGQTFFIILQKEKQGERYVSASKPDES